MGIHNIVNSKQMCLLPELYISCHPSVCDLRVNYFKLTAKVVNSSADAFSGHIFISRVLYSE